MTLGQLALWAKWNRRLVVQNISSEVDCTHELTNVTTARDRRLYQYGLRRADLILTQTQKQSTLLSQCYQLNSVVMPMASAGFSGAQQVSVEERLVKPRVLWVGRLSTEKRLEWLLEVAKAHPQWQFDVVGAANESTEYSRGLLDTAETLPNVNMVGRVPHSQMAALYSNASVLCCTSVYEGFPNVFLEAWSVGLPLVTTFDPDGLVASEGLGAAADSVSSLGKRIGELLDKTNWQEASLRAHAFFEKRHSIDSALSRMENEFVQLNSRLLD
jgi:glycosyltransferase involved in cell wall biosynthesis